MIREQHTKDAHGAILDRTTQIVDQPCLCTVKRTVETGEEQNNNVVELLMSAEGWQSAQVGANRRTQIEYE